MSYREILVYVSGEEAATPISRYAATLAARIGAKLVAIVVETDFVDFGEFDRAIFDKERQDAFELLAKRKGELHDAALRTGAIFEDAARQKGLASEVIYKVEAPTDIPEVITNLARLHDCSIVPTALETSGIRLSVVEEVLFGSGRPLILLPQNRALPTESNAVCIAWDGSRQAARAVHDALPLLRAASVVEIVSVVDEKPLDNVPSGSELVRHLKMHEIEANYCEVRFNGKPIGEQLMQTAITLDAELLIMGAYGHSRVREIVFGGATRAVLNDPLLPILVSA